MFTLHVFILHTIKNHLIIDIICHQCYNKTLKDIGGMFVNMKYKTKQILKKLISFVTTGVMLITFNQNFIYAVSDDSGKQNKKTIYGDLNNDGIIDSFDVALMRSILSENSDIKDYINADLNANKKIDGDDLYLLQSFVLGKINDFPVSTIKVSSETDRTITYAEQVELSLSSEMKSLAESLRTPEKIYEYVINNTKTEFYPDSRKGAVAAFEQCGGNDVDCASLLIALYNCIGIESQYVSGTIKLPLKNAMNLTGAEDVESALNILKNCDSEAFYNSTTNEISLNHTWVCSTIDGKEYHLDCSYKDYIYQDTVFDEIESEYNLSEDSFNYSQAELTCSDFYNSIEGEYFLNDKKIITQSISQLPDSLPYDFEEAHRFSSISEEMSDTITFNLAGEKYTYKSAELYGKQITFEYEASDILVEYSSYCLETISEGDNIYDIIDGAKEDSLIKKYLIMKPVIKIDGESIGYGNPTYIGNLQNTLVQIHTMNQDYEFIKEACVGSMYSFIIDYQNFASHKLTSDINTLYGLSNSVSLSNLYSSEYMGELLEYIGCTYFSELDVYSNLLAEQTNVQYTHNLSIAAVGFEPDLTIRTIAGVDEYDVKESGMFNIDVFANGYTSSSRCSNPEDVKRFNSSVGFISSQLEGSIMEQIFNIRGVSTTSVLQAAQENNIDIHTIYPDNIDELSSLSINDNAKAIITDAVNAGCIVTVPAKDISINEWKGAGYIVYDPESGFSDYRLSRNVSLNGGCATQSLSFTEICAIFFASLAAFGSASMLSNAIAAITFATPIGAILSMAAVVLSASMLTLSFYGLLYTYELVTESMQGDLEAKKELATYNMMDLAASAMTLPPIIVSRMSSAMYGASKQASLIDDYGTVAYNNAVKNSDDLFDAYQAGSRLAKDGVPDDLVKGIIGYGDTFANKAHSVISYSDDFVDLATYSEKNSDEVAKTLWLITEHRPDADPAQLAPLYNTAFKNKTRALNVVDNAADAVIETKVKNFRNMLGDLKREGNVGYAQINIENVSPEIYGFSGFENIDDALSSGAKIDETSIKVAWLPENSSFIAYDAPNNKGDTFLRTPDSEYKILSCLDNLLDGNTSATGKIVLFTELECCDSCTDVIIQFCEKYPNIDVEIVHNNNRRIKIK